MFFVVDPIFVPEPLYVVSVKEAVPRDEFGQFLAQSNGGVNFVLVAELLVRIFPEYAVGTPLSMYSQLYDKVSTNELDFLSIVNESPSSRCQVVGQVISEALGIVVRSA